VYASILEKVGYQSFSNAYEEEMRSAGENYPNAMNELRKVRIL
jgi:hypothetical protein